MSGTTRGTTEGREESHRHPSALGRRPAGVQERVSEWSQLRRDLASNPST